MNDVASMMAFAGAMGPTKPGPKKKAPGGPGRVIAAPRKLESVDGISESEYYGRLLKLLNGAGGTLGGTSQAMQPPGPV